MSNTELKSLPSVIGYVNFRELRNVVIASNVVQVLLDTVLLPVLASHDLWLAEPWNSRLAPFIALVISLLGAKALGKHYLETGRPN